MDTKLIVFFAVIGACLAGIPREKGKVAVEIPSNSTSLFSLFPPSFHFSFLLSYIFILAIVLSILAQRFNQMFL